ncbi:hypothetical protein HPP92_018327 [Vanilla planifolia]|uniref:Uncharacterized protein n=1 Tax=Vanilla planifolia TaxID=51239 RepID=A0A835UMS5_VANPL|nr:hypothetical protein HPP92_018327 [Vanilla planifolia]
MSRVKPLDAPRDPKRQKCTALTLKDPRHREVAMEQNLSGSNFYHEYGSISDCTVGVCDQFADYGRIDEEFFTMWTGRTRSRDLQNATPIALSTSPLTIHHPLTAAIKQTECDLQPLHAQPPVRPRM